jgi:transposase
MKSEQRAKQLREALEKAERSGVGRPYPEALRQAAVEYRREREQEGASVRTVAAELGLTGTSLVRWSRGAVETRAAFRAIEVVGQGQCEERGVEPVSGASAVVVHGPRGLRVQGLTVAELAELIARLS